MLSDVRSNTGVVVFLSQPQTCLINRNYSSCWYWWPTDLSPVSMLTGHNLYQLSAPFRSQQHLKSAGSWTWTWQRYILVIKWYHRCISSTKENTHTYKCIHVQAPTHWHAHTNTHTHTLTHTCTHAHTHTLDSDTFSHKESFLKLISHEPLPAAVWGKLADHLCCGACQRQ